MIPARAVRSGCDPLYPLTISYFLMFNDKACIIRSNSVELSHYRQVDNQLACSSYRWSSDLMGDVKSKLVVALLAYREELIRNGMVFWPFLELLNGRRADKRTANKFFLACIIDYQQNAARAWEQARRFVEEEMCDPADLWRAIVKRHKSESDWLRAKAKYGLHRWDKAHARVYRIGRQVINRYDSDARVIWKSATREEILFRLSELRMGQQISQMVVGALQDTGQIEKSADLKADVHVCRVLGRIVTGATLTPEGATQLARTLKPDAPWLLDRPLFVLGTRGDFTSHAAAGCCAARTPACTRCFGPVREVCTYRQAQARRSE